MTSKTGIKFCLLAVLLLFAGLLTNAQEMPPRPVSLAFNQNMAFGAFYNGAAGGTVTLSPVGSRLSTGSVVLLALGYLYSPAIFEIDGNPGTILHLVSGPDAILTGSNGGTLLLQLGETLPGDPIILTSVPPQRTQVRLGGTLVVGNPFANPPGHYNGYFTIMLVQE